MCGIAGIFHPNKNTNPSIDQIALVRMTDSLEHRGPDEGSTHVEPYIGFGHRRLSVIDVSTGQQPLFNEDNTVVVVFNGEIYNYAQIVPTLEACGHRFKTKSDTEVIVHAWEQWGESCLDHFRGMFAFVLWDRNKSCLFMARDRLGVKPLYFGLTEDGNMAFGSELKAVIAHPKIKKELDESAIQDFMTLGYIPDPKSIYRSVRKLAPGHFVVWNVGKTMPEPRPYWDVHFEPNLKIDEIQAQTELRRLIKESVNLRLVSEVPIGAFLSGGVDSSIVVADMARLSSSPVKTCSIAFDDDAFDETKFAQLVANQYKTDHSTHRVTSDDFGLLDTLVDCFDEPFADSSAIPTYRVSEIARKRVTVALSGDGGDETFAGYRRYRFHMEEERLRSLFPASIRKTVFGTLARVYPQYNWLPRPLRAQATFRGIAAETVEAYTASVSMFKPDVRNALLADKLKNRLDGYQTVDLMRAHAKTANCSDVLSMIQYLDYKTWLPGDINTKVDRMSMAHSLETREPLLDHKLIEFAATLPSSFKLRGGEGKYILKKAYEDSLPNSILYRAKMGFSAPMQKWLKGPMRDAIDGPLSNGPLVESGYFSQSGIRTIVKAHLSGERDHSASIWALLMFDRFLAKNF
jgi:asparagine synthase (glutamine-hydrolysing)